MMHDAEIQKAVDNYIAMEADAKAIDLMRKGMLSSVERLSDGRWKLDIVPFGFVVGDTLDDAMEKARSRC